MKLENYIFIFVLYILWNAAAFFTISYDKRCAKIKGKRRIRERTFFLLSAFFGAVGVLSGMYVFRHKTKHSSFVVFVPLLLLFNWGLIYLILS
ncbi:DUF1294 domain-containing protein [Dendrosporobacter sp. 1207_IL3150]|uniref:DUF1294 domain-containing protein n=1 Tax=Dendrosporobacter sp. 1207_IL3150 TaxID=3084054 RepID=UPI002FD9FC2E